MSTAEELDSRADNRAAAEAGDPAAGPGGAAQTPRQMLLRLFRPYGGSYLAVLGLQIVSSLAGLAPLIAVVELGRVLLGPGPVDSGAVWARVWLGIAGLVVRVVLAAASGGIAHMVDGRLQLSLRRQLARRLGSVPLGWYSGRSSGEITGVVQNDVDQLHYLVAHTPVEVTSAIVVPVASFAYLAWVDWRLTLIALIPVLLGILLRRLLMSEERQREGKEMGIAMGRVGAAAVEFVAGISVVKTFGGGGKAHRRYRKAVDDFADFFRSYVEGSAALASLAALVLSPPFVLLVIFAGGTALVATGAMPAVDLLPFPLFAVALTAPVAALGHGMDNIHAGEQSAERIQSMLAVPSLPEPVHPAEPSGERVEFRGVGFAYEPGHPVLRGVDLTLEPGTTTALVGPSGAGKSTLAQLLPRFFDPTSGAVLLGGADVRDISAQRLYRSVSFVFQDVRLLRTSIADNIALAVPDASRADVVRAATAAGIHERIEAMPRGYDSVIGEDVGLSGGEAQRLSIARALLIDPPVLVLDEAMAFADAKTEAEIRAALGTLMRGRTQLLIAHRLETIVRADRIVVLEDGRIAEAGTYGELVGMNGKFAAMWRAQHSSEHSEKEAGQ